MLVLTRPHHRSVVVSTRELQLPRFRRRRLVDEDIDMGAGPGAPDDVVAERPKEAGAPLQTTRAKPRWTVAVGAATRHDEVVPWPDHPQVGPAIKQQLFQAVRNVVRTSNTVRPRKPSSPLLSRPWNGRATAVTVRKRCSRTQGHCGVTTESDGRAEWGYYQTRWAPPRDVS